jgi:phosphoribosylformylglycinamidine synthase subunit PurL
LYGEAQGRVIVTVPVGMLAGFEAAIGSFPCEKIGVVSGGEVVVDGEFWGSIDWWKETYDSAIEKYLSKEQAGSALSSI